MEFIVTILIIIVFFLSMTAIALFYKYIKQNKTINDLEIKNVSAQLELKKRELKDEVDSMPIADVIAKRNGSDSK